MGIDAREFPGRLLRLDPAFAYAASFLMTFAMGGARSPQSWGLVMSPEMPLSTRGWTRQPRSAEDDPVCTGWRATVEKQQLGDGPLRPLSLREGRAINPGLW